MATAYTPGLAVNARALIRKLRRLPLKGQVLVAVGEAVEPDTVIARTELPGDVSLLRVADRLGITGEELPRVMRKQVGDRIEAGELLAQTPGLLGRWFKSSLTAPVSGTIETVTERTGNVAIRQAPKPVELTAYVRGTVAEVIAEEGAVIESRGALVQGIFGIGGERCGILRPLAEASEAALAAVDAVGAVVVVPERVDEAFYRAAAAAGAVGVVAGSVLDADLRAILGRDIGVAITGEEDVPATLIVTEGFGTVRMAERTEALLSELAGREASISGATQIRAGVIRPEILVPDLSLSADAVGEATAESQALSVGSPVRLIREPYFGCLGTVKRLPPEPVEIGSGARVRVLEAELADGRSAIVPRANVEIVVG